MSLLFASFFASTALAESALLDDKWRYGQTKLVPRILVDVAAIPASAAEWQPRGWIELGGVSAATIGLMLPANPSGDVAIERWIIRELDPFVPDIWGMGMQTVLWGGLVAGWAGTWGASALWHWSEPAEAMSLVAEAVFVSQGYHLVFKTALGREGPADGDGLGLVLGPGAAFGLFPAGTPSGHAATLFSTLGALDAFWHPHWALSVPLHVGMTGLIAMHVVNHRHFLSDSLWGGTMGYAIGRWVVNHRRSTPETRTAGARFTPWFGPSSAGMAWTARW